MCKNVIHINFLLIVLSFTFPDFVLCQTKIFTSDSISFKEWNYNQRKIVRSPEIEIITESGNEIFYSQNFNDPVKIFDGKNASLAVDNRSSIYIVYEDNGIKYSFKRYWEFWSESILISDSSEIGYSPIADCDKDGKVHIIYGVSDSGNNGNTYLNSLKYVTVSEYQKQISSIIYDMKEEDNKDTLVNYTIATHLLFIDETVFIAYQLSNDSIYIKYSMDHGASWKLGTVFHGTDPSLSIGFGKYSGDLIENVTFPVILYMDLAGNLVNNYAEFYTTTYDTNFFWYGSNRIQNSPIDCFCIDDIITPFGYSYIFQKDGALYHAFSDLDKCEIMDTISNNSIVSSIAYKQFDLEKVDIVWFEKKDGIYEMYYQWFEKIPTADNYINKESNLFQMAADPNPFNTNIKFKINTTGSENDLNIYIYDIEGKLLKTFKIYNYINQSDVYWNGSTDYGNYVNSGTYIVKVISGKKSLTRKIVCLH